MKQMTTCGCCGQELPKTIVAFDVATNELIANGKRWRITPGEAEYMVALSRYPGRTLSDEQLWDIVYGARTVADQPTTTDIVKVMVCHMRRSLKGSPLVVETVYGAGYRLVGSVTILDSSVDDLDLWKDEGLYEAADMVGVQ